MGNEDRETIYRNIGGAKEVEEFNREKSMRKEKRISDSSLLTKFDNILSRNFFLNKTKNDYVCYYFYRIRE